jgi:hypothetical protein
MIGSVSFHAKNRGAVRVFQVSVGPMSQTAKTSDTPKPPPVGAEFQPDPTQDLKPAKPALPKEIGGPKGPEPTRYGDWERNGRVSDF